jgi:putative hydroxymethylpyrimidine transport system substrate-binding protein
LVEHLSDRDGTGRRGGTIRLREAARLIRCPHDTPPVETILLTRRKLCIAAAASLASHATAAEPFTIVLDWLLNANHAALLTGVLRGVFARAGADVNLVAPSDPDSPVRLAAAGRADLAVGYGSQINMLVAAGLPVIRVGTLIDRPLNSVMAIGGRGIVRLADLRGKRIGFSVSGVEEAMLAAMLASAGVSRADVTLVKVNFAMVPALLSGSLDAAIGAFRNMEVLQVKMMHQDAVVFLPEDYGVPAYDELILIARKDRAADSRIGAVITALRDATSDLLAAPGPVWDAVAAAHPELNTPLMRASLRETLPAFARDPARLDAARYLAFQDFAARSGLVSKSLPLADFAVTPAV